MRKDYPYFIIIIVLLSLSFLPYLLYDFAFHNDVEIWSYDNRACCGWFSETWHLINVGRFLQSFLQNIYLSFFTDLHSLVYGRALGIVFASIGAILLFYHAIKNGMDRFSGLLFALASFLLPPVQVNLGWVTNFIPGPFAAVIVLLSALIFPQFQSIKSSRAFHKFCIYESLLSFRRKPESSARFMDPGFRRDDPPKFMKRSTREKYLWIKLLISFILLLSALFIYPPTAGFFLLPVFIRVTYLGVKKIEEKVRPLYSLLFFGISCVAYFLIHRFVIMSIYNIRFPKTSFYRFDIAGSIFENLYKFIAEIIPVMLNLWNPAPTAIITIIVLLVILIPLIMSLRMKRVDGATLPAIMFLLFFAINTPCLITPGGPPEFYRAWHPGMAAVLLLFFKGVDTIPWFHIKRATLILFVFIAALFAFDSARHLASTLSKQFQYSIEQVKAQYDPKREHYVIVESRPKSKLFGRERWGELGFIHVLTEGHVSYIIKNILEKSLPSPRPLVSLVAHQDETLFLLEPEIFEKYNPNLRWSSSQGISDPNFVVLDFFEFTYLELREPWPEVEISTDIPTPISCYKLYAGLADSPTMMPKAWKLYGSMDQKNWSFLDSQQKQTNWHEGEARLFKIKDKRDNLHLRFDIEASNKKGIVRIPELRFYTLDVACEDRTYQLKKDYNPDPFLKDTIINGQRIGFAGIATATGLADPQRRLQKALDNIYYTFWETWIVNPIILDIHFINEKTIKCYAFQAGGDRSSDLMPKAWRVFASNDLEHWDLLDSKENEIKWKDNSRRIYTLKNNATYIFYRIKFLDVNNEYILRIYEIDLSEDETCVRPIF